ncbi:MAG: GNAT family N-acetyltransferase [Holosporaceae bacterium]|nr:MAG: GNAT family N-acetyltransferase [Holosporaceae bacterium]
MKYMHKLLFLAALAFINLPTSTWAANANFDPKFPDMLPSAPGRPLNHTFFRRTKANAPVFLQVVESGSPLALTCAIRLYPAQPPEEPSKSDFSTEADYKKALLAYTKTLRKLYTNTDACPQIGLMSFSYEFPQGNDEGALQLSMFNILPAYRSKGYGTHALLTALSTLKSRKQTPFSHFRLGVMEGPFQERLIAFYERIGFSKVEEYDVMSAALGRTQQAMRMVRNDFNPRKPGIFK